MPPTARSPAEGNRSTRLSPSDQSALTDLAWHWEGAYERFALTDGVWQASPAAEPGRIITAATAWQLREKLRADYADRAVSMDAARGERTTRRRLRGTGCAEPEGGITDDQDAE
jgi:hypothetical protein